LEYIAFEAKREVQVNSILDRKTSANLPS
jgi:hypothetical protein